MKSLLLFLFLTIVTIGFSQNSEIPSVKLQDLEGNIITTSEIQNDGKPIVFCFWATWCSPCKRELNNYAELYDDWIDETGVKIVAVSIDDQRSSSRVAPFVNSAGWEYDMLLDPNGEFKRAMNVNNVPHTFVLNGEGKVIWQHNNYADGDEEELYEVLLGLKK